MVMLSESVFADSLKSNSVVIEKPLNTRFTRFLAFPKLISAAFRYLLRYGRLYLY